MDALEIPVTYNGSDLCLKAHVVRFGYVHHIVVELSGTQVTIERDEEGTYRALGDVEKLKEYKVDVELVKEVITVLQLL
jgi:hypothetical protein